MKKNSWFFSYYVWSIIVCLTVAVFACKDDPDPKPANADPVADFSFSPASPKTGEVVNFTNASKNADTYSWSSSPAGFSSTSANPAFTFTSAGTYEITLLASKGSKSASIKKSIVVVQSTTPAPAPVADFSFAPTSPKTGESVKFTNLSQNATSFEWSSSPAGFTSADKDPSFSFSQAGTYQITLKASGAGGNNSVTKSVVVSQATPQPSVDFTFSPASPKVGEKVQFTAQVQNATTFSWSSSPAGFTSTAKDPSYTFDKEGTYQITLNVTGPGGSNSLSKSITVSKAASADPCGPGCYVTKTISTATVAGFALTTTAVYQYNAQKQLIRITTTSMGVNTIADFQYDAQGRVTRNDVTANGVSTYNLYQYTGSNTKPSRMNTYNSSNVLTAYSTYEYNSSNFMLRSNSYNVSGTLTNYSTYEDFTAEGNPRLQKNFTAAGTLESSVATTYQACLPIRIITRDAAGSQTSEQVNTIDAKGLLRKSTHTTNSPIGASVTVTDYQYDCD